MEKLSQTDLEVYLCRHGRTLGSKNFKLDEIVSTACPRHSKQLKSGEKKRFVRREAV